MAKDKNTRTIRGETHWKKVAAAFLPNDTSEQKFRIARIHAFAFAGQRG